MDNSEYSLDFALIGHQDTWEKISNILHRLRGPERDRLSLEQVREVVPWIPPRTIVRIKTRSYPSGEERNGVYIDTFIGPDDLNVDRFKKNIEKVREAAEYALRERVRIAALGGFTSIVLEGDLGLLPNTQPVFTTGNTLTASYIVKGIEEAVKALKSCLEESTVLIIGATGDVGSGCASYLAPKVKRLYLCARNIRRLNEQHRKFESLGISCYISIDPYRYLSDADIILTAASMPVPSFTLEGCKDGALICDAGYPKNIKIIESLSRGITIFYGGMGRVLGGYSFEPDLMESFYDYPVPFIGHGCMLEGMLLSLENRYESYSRGRGNITTERIDEIWMIAQKHGFVLSPFFNHEGLIPMESVTENSRGAL
jgi:fatty aldehyde-generating acyl-ACP reductase